MTNRHPGLISTDHAALIVVDIQERFASALPEFSSIVEQSVRLVRTFKELSLPVLVTEQYPKGLGRTVDALQAVLGEDETFEKTCFSSSGNQELSSRLSELRVRTVLLVGIEAHVCVSQTAHDLLHRGLAVHVAVDAVGSRRPLDERVGLAKMERAGSVLTTSEAAAFELLQDAAHPKFKAIQALFK